MTDYTPKPPCSAESARTTESTVVAAVNSDPTRNTVRPQRHRVLRPATIALAAIVGLWLVHSPLLQGLARPLIVDEPAGDFQYVSVIGWRHQPSGDRCYDVAMELYQRESCRGVLLVEPRLERLVETDAMPSFEVISRCQLAARGLPEEAVSVIRTDGSDDWATARALQRWLVERPDTPVVLLCSAFRSAHLRYALDTVLDRERAARVRVRALSDRRCDETNWWTNRGGIKTFGIEWLRRFHGWCAAGDAPPPPYRSTDEYEDKIERVLLKSTP